MKLLLITSVPIRIQMIYRKKKSLKMKPKLKLRNMVIKSKKKSKLKSKKKSNLRQKYKEVTLVNSHTEIGHYLPFLLIVASASQVCKKWKLLSEDQSLWLKIKDYYPTKKYIKLFDKAVHKAEETYLCPQEHLFEVIPKLMSSFNDQKSI